MRESVKCPHCGLTQWRRPDGVCKRCGTNMDEAPAEPPPQTQAVAESPRPSKGSGLPVIPVLIVVVLGAVCGWVSLSLPGWLKLRGTEVTEFADSLHGVEMAFPPGWHHLRLERGGLPVPHSENEVAPEVLRGSFCLGEVSNSDAVLYLRVRSFGSSTGSPRALGSAEQARIMLNRLHGELQPFNASYEVVVESQDPGVEKTGESYAIQSLAGRSMLRTDAIVTLLAPIYTWSNGGVLHVVTLKFTASGREFHIHAAIPQDRFPLVWPQVRQVIDSATFKPTSG